MDTTLNDRESKVINFMDEVEKIKNSQNAEEQYKQTDDYKLKCIKNEKEKAKGICLDAIFSKIYKDAIPMDDSYKISHGKDLDTEFNDFINMRCHKGMEYYIKEAIKNGSEPAKRLMEAVDTLIKEEYQDKELNIKDTNVNEIPFDVNSDSVQDRLKVISSNMNLPEISEIIKDNVKAQVREEIEKSKKEDEDMKNLQDELNNDPTITSEGAIEKALNLRGIGLKKEYTPSLIEGIMVNKLNTLKESSENIIKEYSPEDDNTNESLSIDADALNKLAFIESVKELTKWNIVSTFNLEKVNKYTSKKIANAYASGLINK